MKKYQKLYQLKQIVKAYTEYSKYAKLSAKKRSPKEYVDKYIQAGQVWRELIKDTPINQYIDGRVLNIAYTLLKGRKYVQIERSVKRENILRDYDWKKIIEIMTFFKDEENTNEIPQSPFPTTQINEPKVKKAEVSNE